MKRELGYFSCYGIEDVYDFLGKERIEKRIEELRDKPTMGQKLENITYGNPDYGYASGKGVLWVFSMLIDFFENELEFTVFLFQKSKNYNEDNYYDGGILKEKWKQYIELQNRKIIRSPEIKDTLEGLGLNQFWIEFHFFYSKIIQALMQNKSYQSNKEIELMLVELFDDYLKNSERITQRFKETRYLWPEGGLGNLVFTQMQTFYKWKEEKRRAKEIREYSKNLGWR